MGKTDSATARRITDAVLGLGPLPQVRVASRNILARLKNDKKTRNGVVHFILPREVGKVDVVEGVPEQLVMASVDQLRRMSGA